MVLMSEESSADISAGESEQHQKSWFEKLKAVEPPGRLKNRARDDRGYLISFTTGFTDQGTPKLLSSEVSKRLFCWRKKVCGVCGDYLEKEMVNFIVHENLNKGVYEFEEPFMHRECADYAAQTCPFLAFSKYGYIKDKSPRPGYTNSEWNSGLGKKRPEQMFLFTTDGFSDVKFIPQVRVWVIANPPIRQPEPINRH
jgi:hypothetical protein